MLLTDFQSDFRNIFFPTDSCLFHSNNKITTHFESGLYTGIIDLQRAFDTVIYQKENSKFILRILKTWNLLWGVPQ